MLHLFTDHVKGVLNQAIDLAYTRNETEVTPIVILAAITMEKGSLAQELLGQFEITTEVAEKIVSCFVAYEAVRGNGNGVDYDYLVKFELQDIEIV
mgnify:CR=1 FL=1